MHRVKPKPERLCRVIEALTTTLQSNRYVAGDLDDKNVTVIPDPVRRELLHIENFQTAQHHSRGGQSLPEAGRQIVSVDTALL